MRKADQLLTKKMFDYKSLWLCEITFAESSNRRKVFVRRFTIQLSLRSSRA